MVLAYTTASRNAATIAAPGVFNPPASVPNAAGDWYAQLLSPGVTVGGLPATLTFVGIPPGLAGVLQINYQIPGGVAAGAQPVIVTVGGVSSKPAYLTIQ